MSNLMVLANKIKEKFPEAVKDIIEFRGEVTVVVAPEAIVEVATFCRDDEELQFNMLSALSGVDYYPDEPRFAVNYVMNSLPLNHTLRLKVYVSGDDPEIPTVTGVWAVANWPEREVYDMFGVRFKGHYNMRRILLPHDWTGHPLRKDYPLGYEEVQFSFNYERVQSQKPHPRE
ncbi:MAG: NADH-quinone oxidoreductase subunit C [Anaerolineae bacterium]